MQRSVDIFLPANQGIDTEDNNITLNDDGGTSYIVYSNSLAVGYLYISNPYGIDAYVTVSYAILEKYRGLGYAKALLSMIDILLSSDVATIKLVIDNSNVASKNLAVCSGYVENTDINTKSNYKVYQKRKIS